MKSYGFRLATLAGVIVAFTSAVAYAEPRLAKFFGDNMVIQRGVPAHVWGEGNSNSSVHVSLGTQRVTTKVHGDRTWEATLAPLPVGGPYTLSVECEGSVTAITNVLCGDVWLCSGQSNMQLPVKEVERAEQKIALVEQPNVRLCMVAKSPSPKAVSSADIRWSVYAPESVRNFSAVACFFVSELRKDPALAQVPIGVVDSSFGGTTCEAWIPERALARFSPKDLHDSMFGIKPGNIFNGMIAPLGPAAFTGVVWYQGESNSAHPEIYPQLLATMIAEWRKQFAQPKLPFFIIQLPEYANLWEGFYWPWLREMQARAVDLIPNTALVVGINTTEGFNLHPKEKLELGRRAALLARRITYGEDIVAQGPIFKIAQVEGSRIRVVFDTGGDALASRGAGPIQGFALAGADGEYRFADAEIEGNSVLVKSLEVPQPRTVRYAWAGMPHASLMNRTGLPAAPFRTDTLPYSNVEIQTQLLTRRVATSSYEIIIDANGMVTSLVFHGAQFLSNEPGPLGGTSIPTFWGPRALVDIRDIGPRLLSCRDDEVTFNLAFEERSMQWTIQNRSKDAITFHLALSPFVKAPDPIADGKVTLARGSATISLEDVDSMTNTPTGLLLSSRIKAGASKTFSWK